MPTFRVQDTEFTAPLGLTADEFVVSSVPFNYPVHFVSNKPGLISIEETVSAAKHPVMLIDKRVEELYAKNSPIVAAVPKIRAEATEDYKQVYSAIELAEFMEQQKVTKASMLIVVGGGIMQDVGAFAAAMFKRGIPWTYIATTLLSQGDSGMGGKTGLNHRKTKNIMALFSAPRNLVLNTDFLKTLTLGDINSGLGEIFRLHVTGGAEFLEIYEALYAKYQAGDENALLNLIRGSQAVKRAIVEVDEFDTDLRRSMNYGHSFGHALEVVVDYRIPHGVAVAIGMLIENEISLSRGVLAKDVRDRILKLGAKLMTPDAREILTGLDLKELVEALKRDKKTLGTVLKLVILERLGQIRFVDFPLDETASVHLAKCIDTVVADL